MSDASISADNAARGRVFVDLWQDVRYAIRAFLKHKAFALTAVLTLALGIGATTAIFSVVNGVLLKPLPFAEPERLVSLIHMVTAGGLDRANHGPATYLTYRDNGRAFEDVGAWETDDVTVTGRGDPERVDVLNVSDGTLPLLRVKPYRGRFFNAEDDAPGRPLRAILTFGYWQRRFGGDESVVGQSIQIDGKPVEVIGVLPPSFKFLRAKPVLLLPMQVDRATATGIEFDFQVLARLKPGVTIEQAERDFGRMIPLLPQPFERLRMQPYLQPLVKDVVHDTGQILWILMAAVGAVLLMACGNVANLFLIRAEGRQQELAMRAALGASRGRLARSLLSESVLLGLCGGALGLVLTRAIVIALQRIAPSELPRVEEIAIDPTVLVFTLAISTLSGILFGVFAVVRFGAPSASALKEGGRSGSDGPARHRTRNALVVTQVALALMLLIVSGLMIRTFAALHQVQPGFTHPEEVQTFLIDIPAGTIGDPEQTARTFEGIATRLTAIPGVTSVGLSSSITMDGEDNGNTLTVEEFPVPEGTMPPLRRFKTIGPGYVETMGNPLAAGRSITWADILSQRPVVMVSEAFAREYWQEPSRAIGKRLRSGRNAPWREIVGVTGHERDDGLDRPPTAIVYWPMLSEAYRWRSMIYAVRSPRVGTDGFLRDVQQAVWSVNANLPLASIQTVSAIQAHSIARTSFALVMLAIASGVALLLGVVGIYGAIAYVAAQRTREIGIRLALGAQIADVRRMFLRHGLVLTAAGVAIGIGVALVLTRAMSTFLFGVGPMDPVTYGVVSAILGAVSLVAMYLPARRASQVDPIVALRADA